MTRPEVRSAALLRFLDLHIRIAKGHSLNLITVRHIYHRLLLAVRSFALGYAAWVVQLYALTFVGCHYMPPPSSLRDAARPVKPIADNMLADKFRKLRNSGSKRAKGERKFSGFKTAISSTSKFEREFP